MDLDNWDGQVELGQFFVSYLSIFKSGAQRCFVQLALKKGLIFFRLISSIRKSDFRTKNKQQKNTPDFRST